MKKRIIFLKSIQFATSLAVTGLFWLVYPGAMAMFATAVGACYMMSSVGSVFDNRIAIWIAFVFSTLTVVLSTLGVMQFVRSEFDFLAGNWSQQVGIFYPPYVFALISVGSAIVVVMHLVSWRWMLRGAVE